MVLIKAKRLPPTTPPSPGWSEYAEGSPPLQPRFGGGSLFSEAAKCPHRSDPLPQARNWRLDLVLGLRLGLVPQIGHRSRA